MKKYASVYDNKHLKQMPESNSKREITDRTRRFADTHVELGGWLSTFQRAGLLPSGGIVTSGYSHQADSIKFLPKELGSARFFKVSCHPGISVTISPRQTTISAQRHYATGLELQMMNKTILELTDFISSRPKARFLSSVTIRK